MKFRCGKSAKERFIAWRDEREDRYCSWHDKFAWLPVRVAQGDCRWLEMVERKYSYMAPDGALYAPSYRAITYPAGWP